MERRFAHDQLKRVRDEWEAAQFAIATVSASMRLDAQVQIAAHGAGVTDSELRRCARNLEITFVIRLFAEFEGILRDYWRDGLGRKTNPKMFPLLNRIADSRSMDPDALQLAHEIREYRNDIIHENCRDGRYDFSQCKRVLGKYLSWLPSQW